MAAEIGDGRSETEAMAELVSLMWERYIAPRAKKELLGHALDGYKAQVTANNGDGTLTVIRPFDSVSVTLRCPPWLAETAVSGDQVLVVALGSMSNAFVLCRADMSGFGQPGERIASIDFSRIKTQGSFTVNGVYGSVEAFSVTRDETGRIDSITDGTGHTVEVVW